jgi:hypothetical protein
MGNVTLTTNFTPSTNQWYHIVWTIDTSGIISFYVNGVVQTLSNYNGKYISCPFDTNYITGIPAINGYVDEFRYYNEILSSIRILSLYNNNIDPSSNTVRNYQLPTLPGSKYYYNQYLTNISASFPITHTSSGTPTLYEIKFSVNDKKNNPIKNATYGYKANTDITTQDQSGGVVFVKTSPLNYTPANYSFNITSGTINNATNGAILLNNVYSSNIYNTNTIITQDASLNGNLYVAGTTNLSNQIFVNDASNNVDISGNLTVSAIQIGFDQPTPTGDNASIEYSQFGNKTVLRINVNKDGLGPNSDNLNLNPTGGVGINNDDPQFNLDVSGNANVTGNTTIQKKLDLGTLGTLGLNLLNRIYPRGSIYINYDNSLNPSDASLLGFGTWTVIPKGTTLVAWASGDTSFGTLGGTGGTAKINPHSHQWAAANSSASYSLYTHDTYNQYTWNSDATKKNFVSDEHQDYYTNNTISADTSFNSNYPPYVVVAMWRRTA